MKEPLPAEEPSDKKAFSLTKDVMKDSFEQALGHVLDKKLGFLSELEGEPVRIRMEDFRKRLKNLQGKGEALDSIAKELMKDKSLLEKEDRTVLINTIADRMANALKYIADYAESEGVTEDGKATRGEEVEGFHSQKVGFKERVGIVGQKGLVEEKMVEFAFGKSWLISSPKT